jgi:glycerophosphoryl diester phosphodiesterase
MAGWTLVVYAFFTAILAPVFIAMVHWGVFRGDRLPAGNSELIQFALSPSGFSYLFLILLITLSGTTIRYAGLFQIITDELRGRNVSITSTTVRITQRAHLLIRLCAITIGAATILALPLFAGILGIYQTYLTEFDINYYLSATPPEWYRAITFGGIWVGLWGIGVLIILGFSLPALPSYLDGRRSLREALKEAWTLPFTKMLVFIKSIGVAVFFWFVIRLISDTILIFSFATLSTWIFDISDSLRILAAFAGSYLILSFIITASISFVGFSLLSAIITKFYYIYIREHKAVVSPGMLQLTKKTIRALRWIGRPKYLAVILSFLIFSSTISSLILTRSPESDEYRPEIITHRALGGGAPENSLAGLQESIQLGTDYAEIDVQLTADGRAVVLHDADLMRVAGHPGRINEMTLNELHQLELYSDNDYPDQLLVIPTLAEYLKMAKGEIGLMIELKYYGFREELAEETIRLIQENKMEDQVMLMSLSVDAVQQVKSLSPNIPMGYLSAVAAGDLSRIPMDFLAMNQQNVTTQMIQNYASRNQPVYAWTVNSTGSMVDMLEKRVSGLITDKPELAKAVASEYSELTNAEKLLLRFGFLILDPFSE